MIWNCLEGNITTGIEVVLVVVIVVVVVVVAAAAAALNNKINQILNG